MLVNELKVYDILLQMLLLYFCCNFNILSTCDYVLIKKIYFKSLTNTFKFQEYLLKDVFLFKSFFSS